MDVKVWRDGNLVLQTRLTNTEPVTQYVFINKIEPWVLLETWVSRVVRPSDLGATDDRELGVLVSWSFVPALPVGATGVIVDRAR
jgi:hypothetical protein